MSVKSKTYSALAKRRHKSLSATKTIAVTFAVSFTVSSVDFPLPDGRSRMYLTGVPARDVEITAAQCTLANPEIRLVFIGDSNDTRFDSFGVLRTIDLLEDETQQQ